VGINSTKVGDFPVEPNGPWLRCDLPFGSTKENADVATINGRDARGNGFGFERVVDGRKNNGVIGNVNDGAATGEVSDDFVFLGLGESAGQDCGHKNQSGASEEVIHEGRVAQGPTAGLEEWAERFRSAPGFAKIEG